MLRNFVASTAFHELTAYKWGCLFSAVFVFYVGSR